LLMLLCKMSGTFTKRMWLTECQYCVIVLLTECQYCVIILSYKIPWTWSISWSWKVYEVTGQIHCVPNNGIIYSQICVTTFFF
jgi:hypothetical protein